MDRDLKIYFSVIGLPAFAFTLGGIWLLVAVFGHARTAAEEARHARGESFARHVQQTMKTTPETKDARAAALRRLVDEEEGAGGAFLWRKGDGLLWEEGFAEKELTIRPDHRWHAVAKKGLSAPRGWQRVPGGAYALTWARLGNQEVAGLLVDMGDMAEEHPLVLFAACLCLTGVLFGSLAAGAWLLLRAARRARAASERKTTFIDNLSHELKMPLAVIRMKTERLLSGRVTDPAKRQAIYETIQSENASLIRQIEDLLELVHLRKGTRRYERKPVDLACVAETVAAGMGDRFVRHGLTVQAAPGGVWAWGDADAVRQIIRNLLDNAAKYAAEKGPVTVTVGRLHGHARVAVADRGDGIAPAAMTHVFDRFHRVDNALTRTVGGTGIGLNLARAFARGMGGDVRVAARPGGGCVFTVELPEVENG
jgi:signal transduction histidine kinase